MQYSEGSLGRVFILKFENGDNLIGSIENLAREKSIGSGIILFIGAIQDGQMVTGPEMPVIPPISHWENYENAWEVFGMASVYPSDKGPKIHVHSSLGRGRESLLGCLREKASVYLIVEAVLFEILGVDARRELDEKSGLYLLSFKKMAEDAHSTSSCMDK
jgi:predicted DNA-binding protein with PD1-like motif